jgi:hypothetical protein
MQSRVIKSRGSQKLGRETIRRFNYVWVAVECTQYLMKTLSIESVKAIKLYLNLKTYQTYC